MRVVIKANVVQMGVTKLGPKYAHVELTNLTKDEPVSKYKMASGDFVQVSGKFVLKGSPWAFIKAFCGAEIVWNGKDKV